MADLRKYQILSDSFRFGFTVEDYGWATVELQPAGASVPYRFRVSYLTDALGDLVRGTVAVCGGARGKLTIVWQLEPITIRCELKVVSSEQLTVSLAEAATETSVSAPLGSFRVASKTFAAAILTGCAEIDRQAYAENWNAYRFPEAELAELAEIL